MKWFLLFFAAVGGLSAFAYHDQILLWLDAPSSQQTLAPQLVANISRAESIFATGFVEGSHEEVRLRFEMTGRLENVFVSEGQRVEPGQVLAQLDSAVLNQQVVQAQADLALEVAQRERLKNAARQETRAVAQSRVLVARAEVARLLERTERIKTLYDRGAATVDEWKESFHPLQSAKARLAEAQALAAETEAPARPDDLKIADAQIQVARAALAHAMLLLERTQLKAPQAGTILHLVRELGELVGPNDSEPVMVFANLDVIRVRAYVEEMHALRVAVGDSVAVTVDGLPNRKFPGTVVFRAPWMDDKRHRTHKPNELLDVKTREIMIELTQAEDLVVGLPVEVWITPTKPAPLLNGPTPNTTSPAIDPSLTETEVAPIKPEEPVPSADPEVHPPLRSARAIEITPRQLNKPGFSNY